MIKRSELLTQELNELKAADEKLYKEMVNYEGRDLANYDADWKNYYENFGRENRRRKEALENEIRKEQYREIEVGEGVTECLYSDRHAGTVTKRTKTTLTMQQDKATLDPNFKPEIISGGFAGHCTNQEKQTYTYERDTAGNITVFHWSEKRGRWQAGSDGSIALIKGRHEFYDYNF